MFFAILKLKTSFCFIFYFNFANSYSRSYNFYILSGKTNILNGGFFIQKSLLFSNVGMYMKKFLK
jgi:hypothetical protein